MLSRVADLREENVIALLLLRENLQVAFALFRIGRFKPVLDTVVLERPSANASDTFLPAMDHEANRVSHELKKH
jgi:hypothetical protein